MKLDFTDLEYLKNIKSYYKNSERYCLIYTKLSFAQLYAIVPDMMKTAIELKVSDIKCLADMNLKNILIGENDSAKTIKQKIRKYKSDVIWEEHIYNVFLVSRYFDKYSSYIVFTDMYNCINKKLEKSELKQYVSGLFTVSFTDKKCTSSANIISVILQLGNGDCAYFLPIVNHLYEEAKNKGKEFYIISFVKDHTEIMKVFFKDAKYVELYNCIELSQYYIDILSTNEQYGKIYAQTFSGDLGTNIFEYLIEYYSLDSPEKIYEKFIKRITCLPKPYTKTINMLRKKYRYIIGIQRISGSSIVSNKSMKEWPVCEAQRFIDLCIANSICVINLEPFMKQNISNVIDMSDFSVSDLYSLIVELDAVIGIDSFCCHIAGILGVSNITLFGSLKEIYNIQSMSFRPITNNFSFYPLDYDIERIKAEYVYKKLINVLSDNLRDNKVYKKYINQKEKVDYEWV